MNPAIRDERLSQFGIATHTPLVVDLVDLIELIDVSLLLEYVGIMLLLALRKISLCLSLLKTTKQEKE